MYRKKSNKIKKIVILILLVTLLLAAGVGVYRYATKDSDTNDDMVSEVNTVNYEPPTEEEKEAGDKQKETIVNTESENDNLPESAEVVIVDSSQYDDEIEVRAFVANVIKDGTCTITFLKDGNMIEKSVPAYADASTTPCIALTLPRSEFGESGEWKLVVEYKNEQIVGSAEGIINIE